MRRSRHSATRRRLLASVCLVAAAGCLDVGEIDDDPAAVDEPIDDGTDVE